MSIEIRDNKEKRIACVIKDAFSSAKEVKIAVAFLKWSGIKVIEKNLNSFLDNNGKLKIIVGLDFFTTEPAAIQYFLDLKEKGNNVEIRCYHIRKPKNEAIAFHPKLYLFESGENYVTVIGSSNLTKGGLCNNVELNTVFTEEKAEHYTTAKGIFDKMWDNKLYCKDATTLISDYNTIATKVQQQNASSANNENEKQANSFFDTHFPQENPEQGNNDTNSPEQPVEKIKKELNFDEIEWVEIVMLYLSSKNLNNFIVIDIISNIVALMQKEFSIRKNTYFILNSLILNRYEKTSKENPNRKYFQTTRTVIPFETKLTSLGEEFLKKCKTKASQLANSQHKEIFELFKNSKL